MSDDSSAVSVDWSTEVRRQAARSLIDLAPATVDELAHHLEDLYTAAQSAGATEPEAREQALRALRELEDETSTARLLATRNPVHSRPHRGRQADDAARAARNRRLDVMTAIRNAFRQLLVRPGFALITTLVLGLGVGATTTVYTVVDSVILSPLPYERPDRLVTIWDRAPG